MCCLDDRATLLLDSVCLPECREGSRCEFKSVEDVVRLLAETLEEPLLLLKIVVYRKKHGDIVA